ncbi:MAG: alpha-mannosidase, partial [Christensenellales bacterium]
CNLTGGESMVRQFLWGQRFTRKYFGYTADSFWLPDTFGYSFAIPQIMKESGVKYFLTTKIAWNDTTKFPYTSFYWQGLDGTRVLTHFNRTHIGPTPETLHEITDGADAIRENRAAPLRLFSYGKGDGGGGPEFEMIESARRLHDLAGVPRSEHMSVSDFMHMLESDIERPSVYAGELYLELHRGTLTNQHEIKRGNRLCEIALHNLELAVVMDAVKRGAVADGADVAPLMNELLVRQFHDILPGTCIHSVHEETRRAIADTIAKAHEMTDKLLPGDGAANEVTLINPLSFERSDVLYIDARGEGADGYASQTFTDLDGKRRMARAGVNLSAFGSAKVRFTDKAD